MACPSCKINATFAKVIGTLLIFLTIVRSFFMIELFVTNTICVIEGKTLEKCGRPQNITAERPILAPSPDIKDVPYIETTVHNNDTNEYDGYINLSQSFIDHQYYTGTKVEILAIIIFLVMIFKWERFHGWQYLKALPKMAHFIIWITFLGIWTACAISVDLVHINHKGNKFELVVATMETFLVVILASAWGFIARQTVRASLTEILSPSLESRWVSVLVGLYNVSLALFAMRMMAFFIYDTSLVAKSIHRLREKTAYKRELSASLHDDVSDDNEELSVKEWHSILLVFSCAFRGSLARFFYSKLFQGVLFPKVCDNVPVMIGGRVLGARDQQGGHQHTVPWLTQSEEDRLLASSHHGYDQTHINSEDNEPVPTYVPPNVHVRELGDMVIVTHDNVRQQQYGSLAEQGDELRRKKRSDRNKDLDKPMCVDVGVQHNSEASTGQKDKKVEDPDSQGKPRAKSHIF